MLHELIQILPAPLCVADSDDQILSWNPALSHLLQGCAPKAGNRPQHATTPPVSLQTLRWTDAVVVPGTADETAQSADAPPGLANFGNAPVRFIRRRRGLLHTSEGSKRYCVFDVYQVGPEFVSDQHAQPPSFLWVMPGDQTSQDDAATNLKSVADAQLLHTSSVRANGSEPMPSADPPASSATPATCFTEPAGSVAEPPVADSALHLARRDSIAGEVSQAQAMQTQVVQDAEVLARELNFATVVLASIQCGLWERDLRSSRLWWSSSLERQMGLAPGEFPGTVEGFMEMVHPACRATVLEARDQALTNGGRYEADLQFIHKDGSLLWGQVRGTVISDAEGRPERIVGIQIDVTEKKLAEQAVRQAAEWMSALSSTVPATFYSFMLNPDNTFSMPFCSDSSLSILGLPAETIRQNPRRLLELLEPADVNACRASIRQSAVLMQEWHQQFRIHHPAKGIRWIEGRSQPRRTPEGGTIWAGVLTDITQNKQLQENAELSRRRLQTILDSVPAPIFVKDRQQRYLQVNREMCRTVGLTAADMLGKSDTELSLTGPHVSHSDDALVISTGESLRAALEPLHTRSGIRWLQTDRIPYVDDASGQVGGMIGVAVDVTDRINAERAMRDSESRLLEAQIIGRIGSFYWDAATNRADWSENLYRLFGIEPSQFTGTFEGYLSLIFKADRETIRSHLQQAFVHEGFFSHDYRICLADGTLRWLRARGKIIRNEHHAVRAMAGTCQDITEQKEAENRLRASEELHRNLLNAIPYAVLIHADETIRFSNSAAASLVGFASAEQLLGMPIHDILVSNPAADDADVARDRSRWVLPENEVSEKLEHTLHRCDGTSIPVEVISTPVIFGRTPSILVALHDLSRRRKMEDDLRQAQKMEAVGRLAGGIAHDFNNLLTVILGYSELLLAGSAPTDPLTPLIAEINKAGNRAAGLTRQLLTFSRRQNVAPVLMDLNWLVLNALQMLERIVGECVDIRVELCAQPVPVIIDPLQLEQVLMNLVANSRDAMPGGGEIVIRTARKRESSDTAYSVLTLSDTGCGIPPGIVDRVFDPFFTTKEAGQGIGLGLAVVHGIVEEAGGWIEVTSEPGVTTSLSISFPQPLLDAPEARDEHRETFSQVRGGSETILLVEDEEAVRDITAMALRSCGYHVLVARSGVAAFELLNDPTHNIELIASDVVLPDMSAQVLAEAVQAGRHSMKLLFMSGYNEDAVVRHGIDSTEFAFIQKPFTPEVFCNMVRAVLDSPDDVPEASSSS